MRERIQQAMSTVFGIPANEIPDDANPEKLENWDSLHHLELMLELEMEFAVRIDTETVPELVSLDAIEEYLRENGAV